MAKFVCLENLDGSFVWVNSDLIERMFWVSKDDVTPHFPSSCSKLMFSNSDFCLVKEPPAEIIDRINEEA